jgi:hypothetical protein
MDATDGATLQIEPIVAKLYITGGARKEDAVPCIAALAPPPRAARGRDGERLFVLVDLTGPASPHLYRELSAVVVQTYWSTAGSITAALRQAAAAANRYLFHTNLDCAPSDRCDGGLVCAVVHNDDVFVLQAGSGRACVLHGGYLECLSHGEGAPPLGIGPLADVRLHHAFIAPGSTLLLASRALIREAGNEGLARVLPQTEVQAVLDGLEQVGSGANFAALVVRWARPLETSVAREAPPSLPRPEREPVRPAPQVRARPRPRPKPARRPGPGLGERMGKGIRSVGRGIAAAVVWLFGGMSTLFRRMLPGSERESRRRARAPRPVPEENRTAMIAIAIGIPVVLAIIVALAYLSFGAEARIQGFIKQAEEEIALAQAAGGITEEARAHWEAALGHANAVITLRPSEPAATAMQVQARAALDLLDGISRLQPVQLWDFGPGALPRQLVVHGQMIFVLDPSGGWVAQLALNPTGDGVVEQEGEPILVRTGQQIGEGEITDLVDLVWVGPGGERQTGGLLILEEDGALVSYDPAWVDEGGAARPGRSFLGTPPTSPRAVGSFGGRFYVLDSEADQIWRYQPRGNTYPERPDRYFVTPPPRSLADARDMAIDGNIYILYHDGTILKFLQGERQLDFDVRELPDDIVEPVALAVDPDGSSDVIYMADRGNRRVVVLELDGTFRAQFRADDAFDALEALAVDEAAGRLYVVSGGRLYAASLP